MAASSDWRTSLTASERYENIQRIQQVIVNSGLSSGQTAFAIESEAYKSSHSREEYDAACSSLPSPPTAQATRTDSPLPDSHVDDPTNEEPGVRIGPYRDCHYVASGVTAEVYRSRNRALKVITETRDIEPHNPHREAKILALLKKPCIPLLETFRDHEQRFVLVFPYMPLTLATLLDQGPLTATQTKSIFRDILSALASIHNQGIIHRDIKPSAVLLVSPTGPAYLSDFGTAWHPTLSAAAEPPDAKILDIGTGAYRAPEVLFGDKSYGPPVDVWGAGVVLAECLHGKLFESRPVHEDGNQLGLILSIFKTVGSPTRESWPEAARFRTPPFEMYRFFEARPWEEILPDVEGGWRELIAAMVRYDSGRVTAEKALTFQCMGT
ncbi:serine/threonine-protein kinase csk1 [Coniochaeta ligniaria NRRL 30616]|uniref:cyclin-dependent kinase n=1 Tax=Coniochaeta ligniaria NRRL 30616 TaxID=1408157 RepID=A0A1J7ILH8_9PEZI|nr:serine/threonine-protein kinase csk1 [Coniochaeta ligniaria NRRL 30616]